MAEDSHGTSQTLVAEAERFLKLFPLGLGAIYLVGFLIVGLQLAGYGASPLELVKIQYLAAGFWCGLVVLVYYGLTTPFRSLYSEMLSSEAPKVTRSSLLPAIMASAATVALVIVGSAISMYFTRKIPWAFFHREEGLADVWPFLNSIGLSTVPLALFDILLRVYLSSDWKIGSPEKFKIKKWLFIIFCFSGLNVELVSYVRAFSKYAYPNIPFSLGGGQTRQVVFWLGTNTAPADSFLERDGTKPYSVPYELLVESENSLVVISPKEGQRAIEFDRKSVGAMVVLGERTGPAHSQRAIPEITRPH